MDSHSEPSRPITGVQGLLCFFTLYLYLITVHYNPPQSGVSGVVVFKCLQPSNSLFDQLWMSAISVLIYATNLPAFFLFSTCGLLIYFIL